MSDLAAEIEERKLKLKNLREQREAKLNTELPKPVVKRNLEFSLNKRPLLEITEPFLYRRNVNTAHVGGHTGVHTDAYKEVPTSVPTSLPTSVDTNVDAGVDAGIHKEAPTNVGAHAGAMDAHYDIHHAELTSVLTSFIDDSCRAVLRALKGTPPLLEISPKQHQLTYETNQELQSIQKFGIKSVNCEVSASNFVALLSIELRSIYLYSMDMPDSPEFTLFIPLGKKVKFSNTEPHILFAGNEYGQLMVFDLKVNTTGGRYGLMPVLKSRDFHFGEVIDLFPVSRNTLLSVHADRNVVVWLRDLLSKPQHTINLEELFQTSNLIPSAADVYEPKDFGYILGYGIGVCYLGLLDGKILKLPQSEQDLNRVIWQGHSGPINVLKLTSFNETSLLMITGGIDWKFKVWKVYLETDEHELLFDIPVGWQIHCMEFLPNSKSVILVGLDEEFQVWDLNESTLSPIMSLKCKVTDFSVTFDRKHVIMNNGTIIDLPDVVDTPQL